ncbi:MAG: KH domain-containing protein [Sarcina sp.]
MKVIELVELITKSLVDSPDDVYITEEVREDKIILKLKVSEIDTGKIIGKQGKVAKAIRTVIKAATIKENKRVELDII